YEVLKQLTLYPDQFIDCFNHVDRDTDRPGLVCDGSCYRLSDPLCSISGEFESLGAIEFFNGFDPPHITFLDQVEKEHTAADVAFGNTYHKTEVCFSKTAFGNFVPFFYFLGEFNFLLCAEQIDSPDFIQIHPDRVVDLDARRGT